MKLSDVRQDSRGLNILVKVIEAKLVLEKMQPTGELLRVAEVLVGDETGTMIVSARNGAW